MEYKGYNISDIETLLLHDILQELKELRLEVTELKRNFNIPTDNTRDVVIVPPYGETLLLTQKPQETERENVKPVEVLPKGKPQEAQEIPKKPVTKKPAKKRKTAKKGKVTK